MTDTASVRYRSLDSPFIWSKQELLSLDQVKREFFYEEEMYACDQENGDSTSGFMGVACGCWK